MPGCSVRNCLNWNGNTKNKGIKYHKFPKDDSIAAKWIKACNNDKLNLNYACICSTHFTTKCYARKPRHLILPQDKNIFRLLKTAIPTENLDLPVETSRKKRKAIISSVNDNGNLTLPKSPIVSSCVEPSVEDPPNVTISPVTVKTENFVEITGDVTLESTDVRVKWILPVDVKNPATFVETSHETFLSPIVPTNLILMTPENAKGSVKSVLCSTVDELYAENERLKLANDVLKKNLDYAYQRLYLQEEAHGKAVNDRIYEVLEPIFTEEQIKKLLNPGKRKI